MIKDKWSRRCRNSRGTSFWNFQTRSIIYINPIRTIMLFTMYVWIWHLISEMVSWSCVGMPVIVGTLLVCCNHCLKLVNRGRSLVSDVKPMPTLFCRMPMEATKLADNNLTMGFWTCAHRWELIHRIWSTITKITPISRLLPISRL